MLTMFLVQSPLLGWFGGLASLKPMALWHYGTMELWNYGNKVLTLMFE